MFTIYQLMFTIYQLHTSIIVSTVFVMYQLMFTVLVVFVLNHTR